MSRGFQPMALLIAYPLLAALPGLVLLAFYFLSRRPIALVAALAWLAYVPYEYGMKLRVLCSGECNIRVDLLLIYPALLLLTAAGVIAFARGKRTR